MSRCPTTTTTKKSNFRISARNFFLTFPQNGTSKELAMERILGKWKEELLWVRIAQEKHKDGELHLHIGIGFNKKKNFKSPNFGDFITEKHGNYQSIRFLAKTLNYIAKHDKECLEFGEVPKTQTKNKTADEVAKMVIEKKNLEEITESFPGFVLLNTRKIKEFQEVLKTTPEVKEKWPGLVIAPPDSKDSTRSVCGWLEKNLFKERDFKQQQLFVSGPPNYNKTSLVNLLSRWVRVYIVPTEERFYDGYSDEDFDLVVFDEFRAKQHSVPFINQFLQGGNMVIRKKGFQASKKKNIPCMILTNFSLEDLFQNHMTRLTIAARLQIVALEEPLPIEKIEFLPSTVQNPPSPQTNNLGGGFIVGDDDDTDEEWVRPRSFFDPNNNNNRTFDPSLIHPVHSHQSPDDPDLPPFFNMSEDSDSD